MTCPNRCFPTAKRGVGTACCRRGTRGVFVYGVTTNLQRMLRLAFGGKQVHEGLQLGIAQDVARSVNLRDLNERTGESRLIVGGQADSPDQGQLNRVEDALAWAKPSPAGSSDSLSCGNGLLLQNGVLMTLSMMPNQPLLDGTRKRKRDELADAGFSKVFIAVDLDVYPAGIHRPDSSKRVRCVKCEDRHD